MRDRRKRPTHPRRERAVLGTVRRGKAEPQARHTRQRLPAKFFETFDVKSLSAGHKPPSCTTLHTVSSNIAGLELWGLNLSDLTVIDHLSEWHRTFMYILLKLGQASFRAVAEAQAGRWWRAGVPRRCAQPDCALGDGLAAVSRAALGQGGLCHGSLALRDAILRCRPNCVKTIMPSFTYV